MNSYSIKKSSKAIAKGYFHYCGIRIGVLVNYNFGGWNRISVLENKKMEL